MPDIDLGIDWAWIVALVIALALVWYVARRSDFAICVRSGRALCRGALPENKHGEIARFLLDDLKLSGNVQIMGKRVRGRLVLWYRGALTDGHKQRIRNFLLTHL